MKWFDNLKITKKLLVGFGAITLIAILLGIIGIVNINKIVKDDKEMYEKATIPMSDASRIANLFQQGRAGLRNMILANNPNEINNYAQRNADIISQIGNLKKEYEKKMASEEVKKAFNEYITKAPAYLNYSNQLVELAKANKDLEAITLINSIEFQNIENAYMDALENLVQINIEEAKNYADINAKAGKSSQTTMIIFIILSILASIGLAIPISNVISNRVKKLAEGAQKIANGDMNIEIEESANDEIGDLTAGFKRMIEAIKLLNSDAILLSNAASAGNFDTRADATKHNGDFRRIIEGVNGTLDIVVEKNAWYEAILDSVPFPIHVIDSNMNWVFLNKAFEKLMIGEGRIKDRTQAVGMPCSTASANICNTENCGIKQLHRGKGETFFDWCGLSCKQDTSFLKNRKGEKIGYVEVVTDLTSILKNRDYTNIEIERIAKNLDMLAKGNVELDFNVQDADEHTKDAKANFEKINNNLKKVKDAIGNLVGDTEILVKSAMEGKLDTRADVSKHSGEYAKIVAGVNNTLDVVINPLNEGINVLSKMATNDYTLEMTGNYNGVLKEFKDQVNTTLKRLLSVQDILIKIGKGDTSRMQEMINIGKRSENDKMMPAAIASFQAMENLQKEAEMLTDAALAGNLQVRGDLNKFEGKYKDIIGGFNKTLDAMVMPLSESLKVLGNFAINDLTVNMKGEYKGAFNELAESINNVHARILNIQRILGNIAKGDLADLESLKKTGKRSENDQLVPSFISAIENINNLVVEVNALSQEAIEGKLNTRADISKHSGEFAKVVGGVNKTLDAVINPLNEAIVVLGKISVNDYTQEMTGNYNGILKEFSGQINTTLKRLLSVQDALIRIGKGDTGRLQEFKSIGKRSENDKIMPAATAGFQAIEDLIKEASMLANAAINGDLNVRGHEDKFEGGYKEIIGGINKTLDAVVEPIEEASQVMQELAQNNLTVSMDGDYKGEYARMKHAVNNTINSLNDTFRELNASSDQVAAGARHISDSSQALSQGSSEQASSVEEITSAITQVASQTKQNAVNAGQANELAGVAKDNAVQGNEQMKEMLIAMHEINESSANISKIIKVIDDIAFQTNILALNAAVEAARAGQHGKGFAVVAEEVRNLAARSANAAKETTDMIEGSIKKVEAGTNIANNTAKALNLIVDDVTKAATIVAQIAIASNEQATGITQINQGIAQISQVTQTNTATAEESASASEELSGQAQLLKEMVAKCKLKNSVNKSSEYKSAYSEAAADSEYVAASAKKVPNAKKVKISLDDKEFGKY